MRFSTPIASRLGRHLVDASFAQSQQCVGELRRADLVSGAGLLPAAMLAHKIGLAGLVERTRASIPARRERRHEDADGELGIALPRERSRCNGRPVATVRAAGRAGPCGLLVRRPGKGSRA